MTLRTKTARNLIALGLFFVLASVSAVATVTGANSGVNSAVRTTEIPVDPLVIDVAYYTNLDPTIDDMEDDCVTKFTLFSPTGLEADVRVDLDLSIRLPSGQMFYFSYRVYETFVSLNFTIEWYNVAVEAGNYTFTVSIHMWGEDIAGTRFIGNLSEQLVFDPREYRPGALPFAIVLF